MSEEKMHTEFKEWLRVHPCNEASAWRAWQAATASKQREIAELSAQVEVMREAVKANHKWHEAYDEHDGYGESELCEQNMKALYTTPSFAILTHDNEVAAKARKKALEEAAQFFFEEQFAYSGRVADILVRAADGMFDFNQGR